MLSVTRALVSSALVVTVWSDELSLIQDIRSHLSIPRPNQRSAAGLMEVASKMLLHGTPTAAEEFVTEITEDIIGEENCLIDGTLDHCPTGEDCSSGNPSCTPGVLAHIQHAHDVDQTSINDEHGKFAKYLTDLKSANVEIGNLVVAESDASSDHKQCRSQENSTECTNKRKCDKELYILWKEWYEDEEQLSTDHGKFSVHFCAAVGSPSFNGTEPVFRTNAVPLMNKWLDSEAETVTSKDKYESHKPFCDSNYSALITKGENCDAFQETLEEASCKYGEKVQSTVQGFDCMWSQLEGSYGWFQGPHQELVDDDANAGEKVWQDIAGLPDGSVLRVKKEEQLRIQEYETMKVVQCLMEEIRNRNGVPCDTATQEATVTTCQQVRHDVDATRLKIDYPEPPPRPVDCTGRAVLPACADGEVCPPCLPVLQPIPCSDEYFTQEFAPLVKFPRAPFTATNPACNEQPVCDQNHVCNLPTAACAAPNSATTTPCSSTLYTELADGALADGWFDTTVGMGVFNFKTTLMHGPWALDLKEISRSWPVLGGNQCTVSWTSYGMHTRDRERDRVWIEGVKIWEEPMTGNEKQDQTWTGDCDSDGDGQITVKWTSDVDQGLHDEAWGFGNVVVSQEGCVQ